MKIRISLSASLLLAGLLAVPSLARADGIALPTSALPQAERASLKVQIDRHRAEHPEAFEALKRVKGHLPEGYRMNRNPYPTAARELRALGPAGLMPMIEALAFEAPARGGATDVEWAAFTAGMIDAIGLLRDARGASVVTAIFERGNARDEVLGAAARAMGRIGRDPELASLLAHAVPGDPRDAFAIQGLGELRRVESAKHLASRLASADDATAPAIAEALGSLGSSWAWKALGPQAAGAGAAVREVCAKALVSDFVRRAAPARAAAREAILMVGHTKTPALLRAARAGATDELARSIDALIARHARSTR